MHVTIIQLTTNPDAPTVPDFEVFANNSDCFRDGVEEHTGEDRNDDISRLVSWLGPAAVLHEKDTGVSGEWLAIDTSALGPVFSEYEKGFAKTLSRLSETYSEDKFRGSRELDTLMQDMNSLYHFDWLYVLDEQGCATPVSDFLRSLALAYPDSCVKLYVGQTFDGDQ